MKNIILQDQEFRVELKGVNYIARFDYEFFSGKYIGDGSYYFHMNVWDTATWNFLGFKIPYRRHLHTKLVGWGSGCHSCGSFKFSNVLDKFYLEPDVAKWKVEEVLEDLEAKKMFESRRKEAKKKYQHVNQI